MGVISNGTTLLDSGSLTSGLTGSMTLISTQNASSSSTISFTSGIDSTYKEYVFKFIDIHPGTAGVFWTFQANAAGGSGYNETITSTSFRAVHTEAGSGQVDYIASIDQANGTSFQNIISDGDIKTDNDSSLVGTLHIFDPSSTTFVKHFIATTNHMVNNSQISNNYVAGYFNTTSAIDEVQFKFDSGNIDSGTIKMYGIK
tara:strand:+ start:102 stop:704 length:603 start_codon:yes stop_codon:yes gene_type:complete